MELHYNPLLWTQRLIAFAVLLQTIELLLLKASFNDNGIWRWDVLRREFTIFPAPIQRLFAIALRYPNFLFLLYLQLAAAILLLLDSELSVWSVMLLVSNLLICLRWRGTFNGGSDYMTVVVLSALVVAVTFKDNDLVVLGCLWYIAIQSCLSYFLAGIAKIQRRNWLNGRALQSFLSSACYESPKIIASILRNSLMLRLLSWSVIFFETSFPLVFVGSGVADTYICIALVFHLINFYLLGLNRFIFAWAATYPALYFCASLVP